MITKYNAAFKKLYFMGGGGIKENDGGGKFNYDLL
jgi:hypothetical protein